MCRTRITRCSSNPQTSEGGWLKRLSAEIGQVRRQRTVFTMRRAAALGFADGDRERVELVEESSVMMCKFSSKSLSFQLHQRFIANAILRGRGIDEAVAETMR